MSNVIRKCVFWSVTVLLLLPLLGPAQEATTRSGKIFISTPQKLNDGWAVGPTAEADIDSLKLLRMLRKIDVNEYPEIHGILIVKDGKLVFEEYFPGHDFEYAAKEHKGRNVAFDRDTIHHMASVTKSVTSLLFGIAVDKRYVRGVQEKLGDYFPEESALLTGNKKNITVQNLLTMSSGLQWNENDMPYGNPKNDAIRLFYFPDPVKYIFSKPLVNEPGTKFTYNGGGTNLIGRIVQKASGLRLDDFAQKYLFAPLGIAESKWAFLKPGFILASGDLRLRPRDMAKLGLLVLDKGIWNGVRVISPEWIEQMTAKQIGLNSNEGYGYQWWLKTYKSGSSEINSVYASGWGGQQILLFPELHTVVVITAGNYLEKSPNEEILTRYILPSIKKDFNCYDEQIIEKETPLPEDLEIRKPGDETRADIAAVSGRWYGKWDNSLSNQLIVEKINNQEATIVYSWADHPDGLFKKGWMRKTAKIDASGRIEFNTDKATWKYQYDINEDVLVGYYIDPQISLKTVMKRKK